MRLPAHAAARGLRHPRWMRCDVRRRSSWLMWCSALGSPRLWSREHRPSGQARGMCAGACGVQSDTVSDAASRIRFDVSANHTNFRSFENQRFCLDHRKTCGRPVGEKYDNRPNNGNGKTDVAGGGPVNLDTTFRAKEDGRLSKCPDRHDISERVLVKAEGTIDGRPCCLSDRHCERLWVTRRIGVYPYT